MTLRSVYRGDKPESAAPFRLPDQIYDERGKPPWARALRAVAGKRRVRTEKNPTLAQAMASEDWDEKWFPAVQGEFEYMKQIGAGYAVDRSEVPTGEQILDSKIDLQIKYSPDGSYVKHKARWVALGNLKWKDPLADDYSPMGGGSTLKLFFQLAVSLQLDMFSIDIKQAFVNSKLPKPVYVRIPKGLAGDEEPERAAASTTKQP